MIPIFIFSFISAILTAISIITYFFNVRKHFEKKFTEAFVCFITELHAPHISKELDMEYQKYINHCILLNLSGFSLEDFFRYTHQHHQHNSKYYADIFEKMQHHKMKTFLSSLVS
jgi:hypothetical protein